MQESHTGSNCFSGKWGIVAQPVVRLLACTGMVAAGLLIGGGIASADSGLGGLGNGHDQNNDSNPRNDTDQTPVNPPVVRIGAREDRGGFEADRVEFGSAVSRDSAVASISVPTVLDLRSVSVESAARSTSGQVVPG